MRFSLQPGFLKQKRYESLVLNFKDGKRKNRQYKGGFSKFQIMSPSPSPLNAIEVQGYKIKSENIRWWTALRIKSVIVSDCYS
jgi:hypothetical protein